MALVQLARKGINAAQSGKDFLDSKANKWIVKPKNVKGIGGFVFDYEGESVANLQADITDHVAENNTIINDHVALKPLKITLRGFSAELVEEKPTGVAGVAGALASLQSGLSIVSAYTGKKTPTQLAKLQALTSKAQSVVASINKTLKRANNLVKMFEKGTPGKTKQEKAYVTLQAMFFSKQIMLVQTPWGTLNNMVIESIAFTQGEDTKWMTDIMVTLKQVQFAITEETKFDESKYAGRAGAQKAPPVNNGKPKGTAKQNSILFDTFGGQ